MTKAQLSASSFILKSSRFEWDDLVAHIKLTHPTVKNWMSIRDVLQFYINSGQLTRTENLRLEEYAKGGAA